MRLFGLRLGIALAFALASGQAVAAQANWYAGGNVGLSILHDSTNTFSGGGTTKTEYDAGVGFGFVGGYEFGNNIRAELEISYRINGADRQLPGSTALNGSTSAFALMGNGIYDFNMGQFVPYLGFGMGFARVSADIDTGGTQLIDDSDMVLAYQFIAGVGYNITPKVVLSLDYRIFGTTDPELTTVGNAKFDSEYFTQNFMLGARYKF